MEALEATQALDRSSEIQDLTERCDALRHEAELNEAARSDQVRALRIELEETVAAKRSIERTVSEW